MSEYYDREKFTGGQKPPQRPPRKKPGDDAWYSWPVIIVLFALGIWPIALVLLFINIFGGEDAKKSTTQKKVEDAEAAVDDMIRQVMAKAEENRANRSTAETKKSTAGGKAKSGKSAAKSKSKKKKNQKIPGKALRIIGICLLAIGAIVTMNFAADFLQGWNPYLEDLFTGLSFMGAGGIMWGRGRYLAQMTRRSQRYIMAIGNVDAMSLNEIAKRVNRTPEKAAKELQKLIDKGYLGEDAYIDYERGYFLRFGATLEEKTVEEEPVAKEMEEGYAGILANIRRANDRIADVTLSHKIDRLEQISAIIFKEVEEHPEKRDRIRTFFDYYLPTTQKLLDSYAEFEEAGVDGEHLRQAKQRIEQTMDAIVEGFENQLDKLYSSDAMDVVSDIKVMETMLQRDAASAARDFGYDRTNGGDVQLKL